MHGYIDAGEPFCGIQAPSMPSIIAGEIEPDEAQPAAALNTRAFVIYPNPANENFTFEQTGAKTYGKVNVEIFSIRGERMMTKDLNGENKHLFPVSELQNGLYFVKIVADGYVETLKLVVTQ